jgi:hypothetical protein
MTEQQKTDRVLVTKLRDLCAEARREAALFALLTVPFRS